MRRDLEQLIGGLSARGVYTNLNTAGVGIAEGRIEAFAEAGLDHLQLSFQGARPTTTDRIGNHRGSHEKKLETARRARAAGLPLTINAPVHRHNIEEVHEFIELALSLGAERLEIANVQYAGWALVNRDALMPDSAAVHRQANIVAAARERLAGIMNIDFVTPDYFATYPKPCMGGWARDAFMVAPDGTVLPCHAAQTIPSLRFERFGPRMLKQIWTDSPAFNAFRGTICGSRAAVAKGARSTGAVADARRWRLPATPPRPIRPAWKSPIHDRMAKASSMPLAKAALRKPSKPPKLRLPPHRVLSSGSAEPVLTDEPLPRSSMASVYASAPCWPRCCTRKIAAFQRRMTLVCRGSDVTRLAVATRHVAEQALARCADEQRKTERAQFAESSHELKVVLAALGKSEARIEHDPALVDARPPRNLQRPLEEKELVGDHVGKLFAVASGVHDDKPRPRFRRHPRDVGLALQAMDIVDDMHAGSDRQSRRLGVISVDRNERPTLRRECFDHRQDSRLLLPGRDGRRAGPGRLAADVDDLGALGQHAPGMRNRTAWLNKLTSIGKAVRRGVHDPHQHGGGAEIEVSSMGKLPSRHA